MIIVESRRKRPETLRKAYPDADIIDITSHAEEPFKQFSPFYPHGDIPVPFSEGYFGASVEGIWQGLKVFENDDVDIKVMQNRTMKNLKRTVRKYGRPLGHRKGINGEQLLDYLSARQQIYIPTYNWVLENKLPKLIQYLRHKSEVLGETIVLLDYETNGDVLNTKKPLSHAQIVKMAVEAKC